MEFSLICSSSVNQISAVPFQKRAKRFTFLHIVTCIKKVYKKVLFLFLLMRGNDRTFLYTSLHSSLTSDKMLFSKLLISCWRNSAAGGCSVTAHSKLTHANCCELPFFYFFIRTCTAGVCMHNKLCKYYLNCNLLSSTVVIFFAYHSSIICS